MPFGQCDLKVVNPRPSLISIVVPVLDEAALIGSFLTHLRASAPGAEVIVVDGGSQDATVSIARSLNDVVIQAPRGRASQMNAGAAIATRAILWFLHVDSILPNNAMGDIMGLLNDPGIVGGCFRLCPWRPWHFLSTICLRKSGWLSGFADHGGCRDLSQAQKARSNAATSRGNNQQSTHVSERRALSHNGPLLLHPFALCPGDADRKSRRSKG